jgi:hypothetical protein
MRRDVDGDASRRWWRRFRVMFRAA